MVETKPEISIFYCPGCRWLPRATWMAQELLETFVEEVSAVSLHPSEQSGTYRILVNEQVVWDRRVDQGFPQPKELKKRVRDIIDPAKGLGHVDL